MSVDIKEYLNRIVNADCVEVMKQLPDNSVDAIITDGPYAIGFMGEEWDEMDKEQFGIAGKEGENDLKVKKNFKILPRYGENNKAFQEFSCRWGREAIRILKPGGHCLSFCGTRTFHRMVCGLEDAGFEVRNAICWIYGSGFPKNLNVGKAIEKKIAKGENIIKTEEMKCLGTGLKPAFEFVSMLRKPISEKTIVENILKWGTGGINIDGGRVGNSGYTNGGQNKSIAFGENMEKQPRCSGIKGRFPSNLVLECLCDEIFVGEPLESKMPGEVKGGIWKKSEGKPAGNTYKGGLIQHTNPECPCAILDRQSGVCLSGKSNNNAKVGQSGYITPFRRGSLISRNDVGGASRFFYQAKTNRNEKWFYCEDCKDVFRVVNKEEHKDHKIILHPTQKSETLLEYLVKMVVPKGGIVLDPFAGTGTTCLTAKRLGFNWIGVDKDEIYCKIANKRLENSDVVVKNNVKVSKKIVEDDKQEDLFDFC
jgi:site-specific DNA-methyltransferase (adenine-specific)